MAFDCAANDERYEVVAELREYDDDALERLLAMLKWAAGRGESQAMLSASGLSIYRRPT